MQPGRRMVSVWPADAALVRVAGDITLARVEESRHSARIDHVWLTLDAGLARPIRISINTFSRRNADAGFDPRVRLGRARETWTLLPPRGVKSIPHFDYADVESRTNVFYESLERPALESLLLVAAAECVRLEAIGTPYHHRRLPGLHQIHSRRASCGVRENLTGLDGALVFYFPRDREAEWWLFKFCGQP